MGARQLGVLQLQARHVRFLPGYEARALFVGSLGNVQTYCDLHLGSSARVEQLDQVQTGGGSITGMCISAVGRAAAFCDSAGHVHLWTDDEDWVETPKHNVNAFAEPIEDHPAPSFAASDKRMSALEFWDEAQAEVVSQSTFMKEFFEMSRMEPELDNHLASKLPAALGDRLVIEKHQRLIHPDLLERAQTKPDFIGQYIETRPEEFAMSHALMFGKESMQRAYVAGTDELFASGSEHPRTPGPRSPSSVRWGERGVEGQEELLGGDGSGDEATEKLLAEIPDMYRKPKMTMSHIGLSDFDFGKRNSTPFAGLEASVPNSFANPVLQCLYFQRELRTVLVEYCSDDPNCLATEAGFLFHMLDQAQGVKSRNKKCEARNLLRTFRLAPDAQALGLLEPTQLEPDQRACAFVRFMLEQFSRSDTSLKSLVSATFGVKFMHCDRWLSQGLEDSHRKSVSLALDIHYPNELSKAVLHDGVVPNLTFCDLLRSTLSQSKRTKLWCKDKNEQVPVVQSKTVIGLSECLILNAASHDNRAVYLPLFRGEGSRGTKGKGGAKAKGAKGGPASGGAGGKGVGGRGLAQFVPFSVVVRIKADGSVQVNEPSPSGNGPLGEGEQEVMYELMGVVSHIYPTNNLVAHVRVPQAYAERANLRSHAKEGSIGAGLAAMARARASSSFAGAMVPREQWLLFNDFAVSHVDDPNEVVDFRHEWRNPCIFFYRRSARDAGSADAAMSEALAKQSGRQPTDLEIFSSPSISTKPPSKSSFVRLKPENLPGKGDLVAIDCEMVALTTEESFINSNGRKVVTQPSQLSLARLSCTTEDETVFIDDYIVTPDPIVDYLTRFSGLVPGDLDPSTSAHHLVSLRTAYLKLKRLVDRGCVFVGHGLLMKDFPVINIFVPPEQVRDTVQLFHVRNNRFLSLSFLASYLLDVDIQGDTHDSIEDARIALRVYKEYRSFKEGGILERKLTEIYEEGRRRNFQ